MAFKTILSIAIVGCLVSQLLAASYPPRNGLYQPHFKTRVRKSSSSNVACTRSALVTTVTFPESFYGVVYAKGYSQDCHVTGNGTKSIKFHSGVHECGIKVTEENGRQKFELFLYVQHDPNIQQSNDERILVRCAPQEIHLSGAMGRREDGYFSHNGNNSNVKNMNGNSRIQVKTMKNHHFAESTVDSVECWMDIMRGRVPFLKAIDGFVDIGEDVTVLIKIKKLLGIDSRIARCYAHDGTHSAKYDLTDDDGCTLDPIIMPNFKMFFNEDTNTKVLHSSFPAFKFPDRSNLHIQCTVVICNTTCPKFDCENEQLVAHKLRKRSNLGDTLMVTKFPSVKETLGVSSFISVQEDFTRQWKSQSYLDGFFTDEAASCLNTSFILTLLSSLLLALLTSLTYGLYVTFRTRNHLKNKPQFS